ncbi:hypothetical protein M050_gp57 [Streptomyces phage Sujidade]|uniref:Uncharacterized protein n=1 Tax=Streptomyces phage Sujidade TaxID=1327759 RepID=R4TB00_9CAUD|nr:hypothetical protein M050_gp57 [Streptomyces phage Sujidade]AGM12155.1 hypothetical protein SUJIDADE_57 [Streptomyces phage Sujidade]
MTGEPKKRKKWTRHFPGERYGTLVLVERDPGGKTWTVECDCGAVKPRTELGQLVNGRQYTCGDYTKHQHPNKIETPTYRAVHSRLEREQGRAAERDCVDCEEQAVHWSYDGLDPNELKSSLGYSYSTKPDHYQPRCKPCHVRFDGNQWTKGTRHRQDTKK